MTATATQASTGVLSEVLARASDTEQWERVDAARDSFERWLDATRANMTAFAHHQSHYATPYRSGRPEHRHKGFRQR